MKQNSGEIHWEFKVSHTLNHCIIQDLTPLSFLYFWLTHIFASFHTRHITASKSLQQPHQHPCSVNLKMLAAHSSKWQNILIILHGVKAQNFCNTSMKIWTVIHIQAGLILCLGYIYENCHANQTQNSH